MDIAQRHTGYWWVPNHKEKMIPGTLFIEENGNAYLETIGVFDEDIINLPYYDVIWGLTSNTKAVINTLIASAYIELTLNNKILANDKLKDEFDALWQRHVLEDSTYKPAVWTPYWHLKNEPFWHFKPLTVGFNVDSLVAPGQTASIGKIQENIEYAYLDETLYNLLQSENNRYLLSRLLIETYLL